MDAVGTCFQNGGKASGNRAVHPLLYQLQRQWKHAQEGRETARSARAAEDGKTKPGSCDPGVRIYSPCLNNSVKQDAGPKT